MTAFVTPPTQEVADNLLAQIEGAISQTFPLLPKSFSRVLAKASAGFFTIVYKYAGWMLLQQFVAHASFDETVVNGKTVRPLVEWGRAFGVGDPVAATRAELTVLPTVLQTGGQIEAGTQLVHAPSGVTYTVVTSTSLTGPLVPVVVRPVADQEGGGGAGEIGNRATGDVLQWALPLADVGTDATVLSLLTTGAAGETEEEYRARVLERTQFPPQGGAYTDYRVWARTVGGVKSVYVYTGAPNEMDVYIEATEASSGSADGFPTQTQIDEVKAAIEFDQAGLASRRPAGVVVNVRSIARSAFNVDVVGLIADDEGAAETAIEEALDEHLRTREPFIAGLSVLPRKDRITESEVSGIVAEAANALGATTTSVTLKQGTIPLSAYNLGHGERAKLGAVNFI